MSESFEGENSTLNESGSVWDVDSYLFKLLGPNPFPMEVTVPMTLIYALIFISGLVGNAITCV